MNRMFWRVQHVLDSLQIETVPITEPDCIDFVQVSGRLYMRAISGGTVVASYRMTVGDLRGMATNVAKTADHAEQRGWG